MSCAQLTFPGKETPRARCDVLSVQISQDLSKVIPAIVSLTHLQPVPGSEWERRVECRLVNALEWRGML